MSCSICWLGGLVDYNEAWQLQKQLLDKRANGIIDDIILLLEHTPTITIGKSGKPANIIVPAEKLEAQGISFITSDRGGDVTFHAPGQLVCYLVIDIRTQKKHVHQYIYELEEIVIRTLKDFSIDAARDDKHAGVWVSQQQIAAIGLSIKKGISMHGFAINVNIQRDYAAYINPCGIPGCKITTVSELAGRNVTIPEVIEKLLPAVSQIFYTKLEWISEMQLKGYL
jgi:lipoate-protein ligase B